MKAITYSEARQELKDVMDSVCKDHEPVIVTRRRGENVVILSHEDYESLLETEHLLSSRANARRLLESLDQARQGKLTPLDEIKH